MNTQRKKTWKDRYLDFTEHDPNIKDDEWKTYTVPGAKRRK
mgnify:CR=1 FL=1